MKRKIEILIVFGIILLPLIIITDLFVKSILFAKLVIIFSVSNNFDLYEKAKGIRVLTRRRLK